MFKVGQEVEFQNTPEITTIYAGSHGQIWGLDFLNHLGFHRVFIYKTGEEAIFHESQLKEVGEKTN